jgi:glycosyl hydrolase family 16
MTRFGPTEIDERFPGPDLDLGVWVPAYLPAWSSRAEAAATYALTRDGLRLSLPPDHGLWCPDRHRPPLRVSAVQSGNWSGPVGSTQAQQPFREGLTVREEQPPFWGFTPHFGRIEVELSATIGPRSMFSAWMVGLELEPEDCGEICVVEVFGDTLRDGQAGLGCGIKKIADPRLEQEFSADPRPLDVRERHVYAVDWQPGRVEFFLDGEHVRTAEQAPDYPMQLILGLFDFPEQPDPEGIEPDEPALTVHRVVGSAR